MSGVVGVWRKLIEMASGEPCVIRQSPVLSLRPSLEVDPSAAEVELPELCDWLSSPAQNRAVLRFLALQLAGRRLFGTYEPSVGQQLAVASQHIQALFLTAEAVRVQHQLALVYPGTIADTNALADALLGLWQAQPPQDFARACDALLVAALSTHPSPALHWLPHEVTAELLAQLRSLRSRGATVARSVSVANELARRLEHIRPERYRPLYGLEHGEDFDLNALTDARIEARDVATLFLLDMSASTEQLSSGSSQRIIDTLKQALIVMTAALQKLGDHYAIYGFSSRGRDQVEVYPIKTFSERLDHHVQARIGGIEPQSGTRMGAALRHMLTKFASINARSKHLILLSDGYPQDHDYGADRRTHSYGIEDTAVALRELSARGPVPFCITVDRAGNDYLRQMCDPSQYMIIDDISQLPRELPKIYRRIARV